MFDILNYFLLPVTLFGIMALSAMGLQLILGGAGMLTLGHAAFFAIGGYSSAAFTVLLAPKLGIHNSLLLLLGGIFFGVIFSALSACIVVIPCLRLRGDYLAIATLGFGQIVENIFYNIPAFGGASGFTNIPHLTNVYVVWIFVFIIAFFMRQFYKTGVGYSILFTRDDELVARCFSISPEKAKLTAFILGSSIAGLGGVFYAHTLQFISPTVADFQKSVEILLAVVLGGRLSVTASVIGAGFLVLIPEILRFVPQIITPWLDILVERSMLSPKLENIIVHFLSNNMLIFSLLVIIIMRNHSDGVVVSLTKKIRTARCGYLKLKT